MTTKGRRLGPYAPLSATYSDDDAIIEAGEAAELLFVRGLAFLATSNSDGYMTRAQVIRRVGTGMRDPLKRAARLVDVGLWEERDGGYLCRSWLKWNRSAEELGRYRAKDRERKAKTRPNGDSPPEPPPGVHEDSARNPDGIHAESEPSPDGFQPLTHAPAQAHHPTSHHSTEEHHHPQTPAAAGGPSAPPDGGGEDPEVIEVIEHVAARWGRSAESLAPLASAVAAALDVWPPDALRRHLADDPPAIDDATSLLRYRLGKLPVGPGACGRRCCTRWRAECDAAQANADRERQEAENAAQRAAEAQQRATERKRQETAAARNEEITTALGAANTNRLVLAYARYPANVRPTPTMIRAVLATVYADHNHDLDAIRVEAETLQRETA